MKNKALISLRVIFCFLGFFQAFEAESLKVWKKSKYNNVTRKEISI